MAEAVANITNWAHNLTKNEAIAVGSIGGAIMLTCVCSLVCMLYISVCSFASEHHYVEKTHVARKRKRRRRKLEDVVEENFSDEDVDDIHVEVAKPLKIHMKK